MVSKDDRPAGGSRPSLLSTAQQGAADGHSVLGALDGKADKPARMAKAPKESRPAKAAEAPKAAGMQARPARRRGLALWSAAGAGVLALAGGALAWMASVPDDESVDAVAAPAPVMMAAPAPRGAAVVTAPAPSGATATTPAAGGASVTTPAGDSDVSTAAILNDTAAPKAPADKQPSLKDMLAAPVAKAAPHGDALTQALERPSPKAEVEPKDKEKGAAPHKEARAEARRKPVAKEKPKAAPARPQDRDATLLAALMAHVEPSSTAPKKSTPAQQLKSCRQYNAAGAEQCRARLCSNTAKHEPECKARNKGKAASDS